MGRSPTGIRKIRRDGKTTGVMFTQKDQQRTQNLARWYVLPMSILIRAELDRKYWIGGKSSLKGTDQARRKIASTQRSLIRRISTLRRVEVNHHSGVGPVINSLTFNPSFSSSGGVQTAYYCTRYGAKIFDFGWDVNTSSYALFAAHAFMAASVGVTIEALGFKVYSEREFTSGIDKDGNAIEGNYKTAFVSSTGNPTTKEPDVVIPAADNKHFIAVECERKKNRKPREYAEKLEAYQANPNIISVWYICEGQTVAKHVIEGAEKAIPEGSEMGFRPVVVNSRDGFYDIPFSNPALAPMLQDLKKIRSYSAEETAA